jgi:hypothetical protein
MVRKGSWTLATVWDLSSPHQSACVDGSFCFHSQAAALLGIALACLPLAPGSVLVPGALASPYIKQGGSAGFLPIQKKGRNAGPVPSLKPSPSYQGPSLPPDSEYAEKDDCDTPPSPSLQCSSLTFNLLFLLSLTLGARRGRQDEQSYYKGTY